MADEAIGLWQAWGLWLGGHELGDYRMLGMPMLFWGRAGKIVQFLSAFTLVLAIIGYEEIGRWRDRVKARADRIHHAVGGWLVEPVRADRLFRLFEAAIPATMLLIWWAHGDRITAATQAAKAYLAVEQPLLAWTVAAGLNLIAYLALALLSILAVLAGSWALLVGAAYVPYWVIAALAATVGSVSSEKKASKVALGLLVIGFFFDLLAS